MRTCRPLEPTRGLRHNLGHAICGVLFMRIVCLLLATAVLLAACATEPAVKAAGQGDSRYAAGKAGVGWKF
jgi:predicted small secreted protein